MNKLERKFLNGETLSNNELNSLLNSWESEANAYEFHEIAIF